MLAFLLVKNKNTNDFTDEKCAQNKLLATIHRQNNSVGDW
jgi:hypothetical protein